MSAIRAKSGSIESSIFKSRVFLDPSISKGHDIPHIIQVRIYDIGRYFQSSPTWKAAYRSIYGIDDQESRPVPSARTPLGSFTDSAACSLTDHFQLRLGGLEIVADVGGDAAQPFGGYQTLQHLHMGVIRGLEMMQFVFQPQGSIFGKA